MTQFFLFAHEIMIFFINYNTPKFLLICTKKELVHMWNKEVGIFIMLIPFKV